MKSSRDKLRFFCILIARDKKFYILCVYIQEVLIEIQDEYDVRFKLILHPFSRHLRPAHFIPSTALQLGHVRGGTSCTKEMETVFEVCCF